MTHWKNYSSTVLEGRTSCAENYHKGRPSYPKEAFTHLRNILGIRKEKTVIDLAAGTGKLTECLLETKAHIIAVEPMEEMREVFRSLFPHIDLLDGKAESIPLQEASADTVLVGTAFHWFEGTKALAEIARVLKSKGGLGLIWNVFDDNVGWVKQLYTLRDKYAENHVPTRHDFQEWKKAFKKEPVLFSPLQHRTISFSYLGNVQRIIERMLSSSVIAPLPLYKHEVIVQEICRSMGISQAEAKEKELLIPYRTEIYWAFKL